jgi:hypothetical protein
LSAWPFAKLRESQTTLRSKLTQAEQLTDELCRARDEAKVAVYRRERVLLAELGSVPVSDAELQRLRHAHDMATHAIEEHRNEVERVQEVLRAVNAELHQRALRLDGEIQQRNIAAQRGKWPEAQR